MAPGISLRESIRWLPDQASEPTSTIVLTSPENRFVDIRIYKPQHERELVEAKEDVLPSSRLEWAFAGTSSSELRHPEEGKAVVHSKWRHWVDCRNPDADGVVDEGDMYPQTDGRTLEKGSMVNPATGKLTEYEELWKDLDPTVIKKEPKEDAPKVSCVVLQLQDDEHEARGVVVRLGQYCQGVLRVGKHFSLERWEWKCEKEGWKRLVRIGDLWVPCGVATEDERLALDGEVKHVLPSVLKRHRQAPQQAHIAASPFRNEQYTSEQFIESAGVVLIHRSSRKVCIIHDNHNGQWVLPKGRRNIDETYEDAATRETTEETGYLCDHLPVDMKSRAPSVGDDGDGVRNYRRVYAPFMVTIRHVGGGNVKIIWWYVAQINKRRVKTAGEQQYDAELLDFRTAIDKLSFADDQAVMKRGLRLYVDTYESTGNAL